MKVTLFAIAGFVSLAGCAAQGPSTVWGKPGVTKSVYGSDIGLCTGLATQQGGGSGANTAGGISGQNSSPPLDQPGRIAQRPSNSAPTPASAAGTSSSLPASGSYSGTASADYAQRAATQQRAQEMLAKRAQAETFRRCISDRGYQEFALTPEQRAHLATLRPNSSEYLEYLYQVGSAPADAAPAK